MLLLDKIICNMTSVFPFCKGILFFTGFALKFIKIMNMETLFRFFFITIQSGHCCSTSYFIGQLAIFSIFIYLKEFGYGFESKFWNFFSQICVRPHAFLVNIPWRVSLRGVESILCSNFLSGNALCCYKIVRKQDHSRMNGITGFL